MASTTDLAGPASTTANSWGRSRIDSRAAEVGKAGIHQPYAMVQVTAQAPQCTRVKYTDCACGRSLRFNLKLSLLRSHAWRVSTMKPQVARSISYLFAYAALYAVAQLSSVTFAQGRKSCSIVLSCELLFMFAVRHSYYLRRLHSVASNAARLHLEPHLVRKQHN